MRRGKKVGGEVGFVNKTYLITGFLVSFGPRGTSPRSSPGWAETRGRSSRSLRRAAGNQRSARCLSPGQSAESSRSGKRAARTCRSGTSAQHTESRNSLNTGTFFIHRKDETFQSHSWSFSFIKRQFVRLEILFAPHPSLRLFTQREHPRALSCLESPPTFLQSPRLLWTESIFFFFSAKVARACAQA